MAGPISHIVITEKVFDKYFSQFNHQEFILGTSFPDIRYLPNVEREKTHSEECSLENILKERSSFEAGVKFHNLVDKKWISFIQGNNVFYEIKATALTTRAAKVIEDGLLYNKVENWTKIEKVFEIIPQDALTYDVSKKDIIKWFNILKLYVSKPVNVDSINNFLDGISFEKKIELFKEVEMLNEKLVDKNYILKFYDSFSIG